MCRFPITVAMACARCAVSPAAPSVSPDPPVVSQARSLHSIEPSPSIFSQAAGILQPGCLKAAVCLHDSSRRSAGLDGEAEALALELCAAYL